MDFDRMELQEPSSVALGITQPILNRMHCPWSPHTSLMYIKHTHTTHIHVHVHEAHTVTVPHHVAIGLALHLGLHCQLSKHYCKLFTNFVSLWPISNTLRQNSDNLLHYAGLHADHSFKSSLLTARTSTDWIMMCMHCDNYNNDGWISCNALFSAVKMWSL